MKFFMNKSIWTKIAIILIFVILFEFIVAKPSIGAAEVGDDNVEFIGKLTSPILSLVVTLADAVMGVTHSSIMGVSTSLMPIDVDSSIWEILGKIIVVAVAVVAAIVTVAGAIASGVGIPALIMGIGKAMLSIGVKAGIGWFVVDMVGSSSSAGISKVSASSFPDDITLPSTVYLPVYSISPEEIFQGKILLFNIDFFSKPIEIKEELGPVLDEDGNPEKDENGNEIQEVKGYYYEDEDGNKVTTSPQNMAEQLGGTVSKWYVGLRNIAIVLMMIVLLYIGIRMLLSTVASDKAKYKQMIYDWLVGMLLLFLMHYIMAFSVTIVNQLTNVVSASVDENAYAVKMPVDKNDKMVEFFNENDMTYMLYDEEGNYATGRENEDGTEDADADDVAYVLYPTNMIGKLRLELQLASWGTEYVGYSIAYVVIVMFTLFFIVTYLRRVVYMAFLTMMAPMVALTYPIDKINDGSAQGFDKWFKEYIFNLLIQPMHLLLYYILVTSAFDLAGQNIIYSLVAIGFMIPAEKLLRSFFGFEKASTPGLLSGAAGAAVTMAGISKVAGLLGGKKKGGSGNNQVGGASGDTENEENTKFRFNGDFDKTQALAEDNGTDYNKEALNKYESEGYGKNANGEYYNPWTNEYDKAYDPTKDKSYNNELVNKDLDNQAREQLEGKPKRNLKLRAARSLKTGTYRLPGRLLRGGGKAIQGVGRVAGATAFGAVGLAAGIAAGDPSQAFTNMAAAGGAGYFVGKTVGDSFTKEMRNNNLLEKQANRIYNQDKYKEIEENDQLRKMRKEYKEAFLDNGYDKDTVKDMLNNGTMNRYIKNNIDAKDAITIEKMRKEDSSLTQTKGMAYAEYAKRVGDDYKGPNRKKWIELFSTEYQQKANKDKDTADRLGNETMKKIDKFNKVKDKLK